MNAVTEIRPASPLVVVLEQQASLSATVLELCDFLHIRVTRVRTGEELADVLHAERPICVLAHTQEAGAQVCDALVVVAQTDHALPVLLVPEDTSSEPVGLDAQTAIETLSNVFWLPRQPGLRMLVEFLFMAERRTDTPGLLPA